MEKNRIINWKILTFKDWDQNGMPLHEGIIKLIVTFYRLNNCKFYISISFGVDFINDPISDKFIRAEIFSLVNKIRNLEYTPN